MEKTESVWAVCLQYPKGTPQISIVSDYKAARSEFLKFFINCPFDKITHMSINPEEIEDGDEGIPLIIGLENGTVFLGCRRDVVPLPPLSVPPKLAPMWPNDR